MDIEEIRTYCLAKKASEESMPFDDSVLVFKVMGKIFACIFLNIPDRLVLKCDPDYAIWLRDFYPAIEPAWHFNKKYWNQHKISKLGDALLVKLIDHSYEEVLKKISRKDRAVYDSLP